MTGSLIAATSGSSPGPGSIAFGVAVAAAVSFFFGWRSWRRAVRLEDAPTVPPSAVPFGRAETSGRAALPEGGAPVGRSAWVWYRFAVQKYERDGDGDGDWNTKAEGRSTARFLVADDHGAVLVDPSGAKVEGVGGRPPAIEALTVRALSELAGIEPVKAMLDVDEPIGSLRGRWRVLEEYLPVGRPVTVLGPVRPDPSNPAVPVFRKDDGPGGDLYVASGTAREVEARNRSGSLAVVGAPLVAGLAAGVAAALRDLTPVIGLAVGGPPLAAASVRWVLDRYNRIVITANQVEACWSMIDVALARRATLVPQLVAVVEASFGQEGSVQEALTSTRWEGRARAEVDEGTAVRAVTLEVAPVLAALAERYPSLTSNENALELQRQLVDVEHRIASARTVYNDAVALLLDRMQQFPGSLVAGRFRDRRSTYWKV